MNKSKYYLIATTAALALVVSLPVVVSAESGSGSRPAGLTQALKQKIESAQNGNYRNTMMEDRQAGRVDDSSSSTLRQFRGPDGRPMMNATATRMMLGSTTAPRMDREDGDDRAERARRMASSTVREEVRDNMKEKREAKMEESRNKAKKHLVEQSNQALKNIYQIRSRVAARISSATSTRDMTEPKALLVTADAKIALADAAVRAFASYTASTTATTTDAIATGRSLGEAAVRALNDAKKALNDVVVSIAHSMGYKIGRDGKIEGAATTTATTTVQ